MLQISKIYIIQGELFNMAIINLQPLTWFVEVNQTNHDLGYCIVNPPL